MFWRMKEDYCTDFGRGEASDVAPAAEGGHYKGLSGISRKGSGRFGAVIERENARAGARRSCGGQRCVRLTRGPGNNFRYGRGGGFHGNARGVSGDTRFRFFFNTDQALIGNLPAEVSVLAALLEMVLEEDGTAGIGNKNAGSGQKNITSAILHLHTTPEKG